MFIAMRDNHTIFVPTLAILEKLQPADRFANICSNVKRAHDLGVRIACGGDMGTFSHGENAREMELLLMCGIPMPDVLEACGGERCGRRFGWFEEGYQADIVALDVDPRDGERRTGALMPERVSFVMKDGAVWKMDGKAVGMI